MLMKSVWNFWAAQCLIEELVRLGVTRYVIAPGSRSAPLILAITQHPQVTCYSHFDERGAGFFALGLAQRLNQPAAVVTTSGSAVANLLPAVVEARQAQLPLILLTADRPPELINCGANQAIVQPGIFSHFTVRNCYLDAPAKGFDPVLLLEKTDTCCFPELRGPVHINCAFREPLYPEHDHEEGLPPLQDCQGLPPEWLNSTKTWLALSCPPERACDSLGDTKALFADGDWTQWQGCRGILLAGQLTPAEGAAVARLAIQLGWPLLADIQAHCRMQPDLDTGSSGSGAVTPVYGYYDFWLRSEKAVNIFSQAELLVQFGGHLTSKRLQQWIQQQAPEEHWCVADTEYCPDPDHRVSRWFKASVKTMAERFSAGMLAGNSGASPWQPWLEDLNQLESGCHETLTGYFRQAENLTEVSVCWHLARLLPSASQCFLGNSMPVRLMDMLTQRSQIHWFSQRGASGIDGVLAHTCGIARASSGVTTLIVGDLSLLHDINSLALSGELQGDNCQPCIVVAINNNGGNIFRFLPVPENVRCRWFQTPHGLSFRALCDGFGVRYEAPVSVADLTNCYQTALTIPGLTVIEIQVPENGAFDELGNIRDALGALLL